MILTDAGPLVALLDRADADHDRCRRALRHLEAPMLTTWPVFTEAMYLVGDRASWRGQELLWRMVERGDLEVRALDVPLIRRSHDLMRQYQDLPMDLADATLVALAESLSLHRVFTLDSDFRVYRLKGRGTFEMVPR